MLKYQIVEGDFMKPIIGIVSTPNLDSNGGKMFCTDLKIHNWVIKCGGIPLSIMPTNIDDVFNKKYQELNELSKDEIKDLVKILDMCDGIIKPGGTSIQSFHKIIYNYTVNKNMPYLGICNGMQLMVKAYDNDDVLTKTTNNHYIEEVNAHNVHIENGTLLKKIVKKDTILVSSRHNYCVHDLNKFKISGKADDGVIEAIENPKCKYNIGLQWHPELFDFDHEDSINIFNSFINEAIIYNTQKVSKKTIY